MSSGNTKLTLDKSQNATVNLTVLRRVDQEIEEILASSNYCAVYQHDDATQTWLKRGIEGPAYIVRCSRAPVHRLWVVSRVGQKFLRQDVLPSLTLMCMPSKESPEYYIVKDKDQPPVALWWPAEDREEARGLWEVMKRCVQEASSSNSAGQALLASLMKKEGGGTGGGSGGGSSRGSAGGGTASLAPSVAMLFAGAAASSSGGGSAAALQQAAAAAEAAAAAAARPRQLAQPQAPVLLGSSSQAAAAAAAASAAAAAAAGGEAGSGSAGSSSGSVMSSFELSKEALRSTLLEFLSDERFMDVLHVKYLQTLKAKRERGKSSGGGAQ